MERFADIIISFSPHIIIPVLYIKIMTGKNGLIKRIERKNPESKGKRFVYSLLIALLSVGVWFCGAYAVMNIFLVVLNLIPGIAI